MADSSKQACKACGEPCKGGAVPGERGGVICRDADECFIAFCRNRRPLKPVAEGGKTDE
ncbi:hypothetical protein PV646_28560 [Streptomyces sp. ID05-26A]|nr:hypothetical protein [Streptomyces sp. ID05-26A]